eukprot:926610_1
MLKTLHGLRLLAPLIVIIIIAMHFITLKCYSRTQIICEQRKFSRRANNDSAKGQVWTCTKRHDGCEAKIWMKDGSIVEIGHHNWMEAQWHNPNIDHDVMDEDEINKMHSMNRMLSEVSRGVDPKKAYENEVLSDWKTSQLWTGFHGKIADHLYGTKSVITPKVPNRFNIGKKFDENPHWKYNLYGFQRRRRGTKGKEEQGKEDDQGEGEEQGKGEEQ